MKKKTFSKIIILLILSFVISISRGSILVYGQSSSASDDYTDNEEIRQLNGQIENQKDLIKKKQDQQAALSKALAEKQAEKANLANQIAILDNRSEKIALDIESTQVEIEKSKLEIEKTDLEIADTNTQIEAEKNNIANALNLLHKKDGISSLEIFLLNNSLSDFLNQVKYVENINGELKNSLDRMYDLKLSLENEIALQKEKKTELDNFKKKLENQKVSLLAEQETQAYLLEQTKSSEAEYQRLLRQAKQEQERAAADIVNLEKTVREKLEKLSKDSLEFNDSGFVWPVPKNTVTAYFHDPDYPFRKVFEHPAIDIRAKQGTTLRAAASGYVARAKDSGMGYSYIMIVHGNGLSTVDGQVSKISVKEDEYVTQGQIIGASGGLPGTPGAGPLTTGAHLHFEVRLNGIPVNPLEYLP